MTLLSSTLPPDLPTIHPLPPVSSPTCQDEQGPLEYIIRLMVEHNDYLFTRLVASSIRSLSLVSRTIFKFMAPRISFANIIFCLKLQPHFRQRNLFLWSRLHLVLTI